MMTVRLRLAWLLARWALVERRQPQATESQLAMRCWPFDCDINRHMNNSRYLALMDLGRYHLTLRSGLWRELWRRRWSPMLVRAEIDFKRGLSPGQPFVLETTLARHTTRSAVMRQRFTSQGQVVAEAQVTAVFFHAGKAQDLTGLMALFGEFAEPPEFAGQSE
jgi:acyl-CoA thioesterase FadM